MENLDLSFIFKIITIWFVLIVISFGIMLFRNDYSKIVSDLNFLIKKGSFRNKIVLFFLFLLLPFTVFKTIKIIIKNK